MSDIAYGLDGRIAIVTGAASGIGAATAALLAANRVSVCCADLDLDGAEDVAKQITADGRAALAVEADVASEEANVSMVARAEAELGPLSIAFLNAGITGIAPIVDLELEQWARILGVNLTGVMLGMKHCGRAIARAGGGSIVVTSSVAGRLGAPGGGAYTATKHGVIGLVKCAAAEMASAGIRVNAVCPGAVDTPILGVAHGDVAFLERHVAPGHPIGRVGQAPEIAHVAAFLASDASSFMTGAAVAVDGAATSVVAGFGRLSKVLG